MKSPAKTKRVSQKKTPSVKTKVKRISPKKSPVKKPTTKKSPTRRSPTRKSPCKANDIGLQIKKIPHTDYYIDINDEQLQKWNDFRDLVIMYKNEPNETNCEMLFTTVSELKYKPQGLVEAVDELRDESFSFGKENQNRQEIVNEILSYIWIFTNSDCLIEVGSRVFHCKNLMAIGGQGIIVSAEENGKEYIVKMAAYDNEELKGEVNKLHSLKNVKGIIHPVFENELIILGNESEGEIIYASIFPKFGPSLSHLVKYEQFNFSDKFLEWTVKEIMSTLVRIHEEGYIHLDIHPANILLGSYDKRKKSYEPKLYLIDFGISEVKKEENGKIVGDIGTVKYSSPYIMERPPNHIDDAISLIFTITYLKDGYLPWIEDEHSYDVRQKKKAFIETGEYKKIPYISNLL